MLDPMLANEITLSMDACADKLPVPAKWINKPDNDNYSDRWMTKQCFWINNDYIKNKYKI